MNVALAVVLALLMGAQAVPPPGRTTLTGTLYGNWGGATGTASGKILLVVNLKLYSLDWQKPYPEAFSSVNCRYAGAVWEVEVRLRDSQNGSLLSAKCSEKRIGPELSGVLLVSKVLDLLADRKFEPAYDLFTPSFKKLRSLSDFKTEFGKLDLSFYEMSRGGTCLEIRSRSTQNEMEVMAGVECYIDNEDKLPVNLLFHISPEKPQSQKAPIQMKIADMKIVP